MKASVFLILLALLFLGCSTTPPPPVYVGLAGPQPPLPEPEPEPIIRTLTAKHKTLAEFSVVTQISECDEDTPLCPEECLHQGTFALFHIQKSLGYKEIDSRAGGPWEIGKTFHLQLKNVKDEFVQGVELYEIINFVRRGDILKLHWNEYLVQQGDNSWYEEEVSYIWY